MIVDCSADMFTVHRMENARTPRKYHMKRILTATLLAIVLVAVVHAQATLTGKWEGKTKH
jgi:hypothetical protein